MIKIKDELDIKDMIGLHPNLYILFGAFYHYATLHNLPVTITSLKEDVPGRKTTTHTDGRALDASAKNWSPYHVHAVCHRLNSKYKEIAALSSESLRPRACIYHKIDGGVPHFHLQVRPGLPEITYN